MLGCSDKITGVCNVQSEIYPRSYRSLKQGIIIETKSGLGLVFVFFLHSFGFFKF